MVEYFGSVPNDRNQADFADAASTAAGSALHQRIRWLVDTFAPTTGHFLISLHLSYLQYSWYLSAYPAAAHTWTFNAYCCAWILLAAASISSNDISNTSLASPASGDATVTAGPFVGVSVFAAEASGGVAEISTRRPSASS